MCAHCAWPTSPHTSMRRLEVHATPLAGLRRIDRRLLGDARGYLARMYCAEELADAGWPGAIAQINHTFTAARGTVRGLHFQRAPHAEAKLVSCLAGEVWDVAVDLRAGSSTFGRWHAETLSAANGRALLIPAGFAHGFQALSRDVAMLYLHSAAHAPQAEGGLHCEDPRLAIAWPLPVRGLSPRDAAQPSFDTDFQGLTL